MIQAIVSDFSRVLLFPRDQNYSGSLNKLHQELLQETDYDFWKHFKLNDELLAFYQSLSASIPVFIFTSDSIQDHPPLHEKIKDVFKAILSAKELGIQKNDPEAYHVLTSKLNIPSNEILYIDDSLENIAAAKNSGLKTAMYQNNQQIIERIAQEIEGTIDLDI